jgi:hypothetical protein
MGLETDNPVFSTTMPKRCEVFSSHHFFLPKTATVHSNADNETPTFFTSNGNPPLLVSWPRWGVRYEDAPLQEPLQCLALTRTFL